MKKFILAGALVAAMWTSQAGAQSPTSIAISIEKSFLQWSWAQGQPPDDGMVQQFIVRCGRESQKYFTTQFVAADQRTIPVKQVITGVGQWFCVVTASNEAGESSPTNEVSFLAGMVPVAPTNLIVVGK